MTRHGAAYGLEMTMDDSDNLVRMRLTRIARALDLPPDHFSTPAVPSADSSGARLAEATECLRLWHRIRTPENRRRALETLRALAESEEV